MSADSGSAYDAAPEPMQPARPTSGEETPSMMLDLPGMTAMAKVEVVVDADDLPFVELLLRAEGVTGWTGMTGLSGAGHSGRNEGRLLFNERSGPAMIVAVLPPDRLPGVVAGLQELFTTHTGVMFVSETWVSRPEYFRE